MAGMLNCSEPATLSILIFKLSKDSLSVYIVYQSCVDCQQTTAQSLSSSVLGLLY